MPADGGFLVEELLDAIASQLDRTQDALALKAVNRPLTYAIKDFSMELKVFVEMDPDGRVRLRHGAPNESGASTLQIGFTTITRPMIEENTIELAQTRAPTLAEVGLGPDERRSLERLGVRNAAELQRLGSATGARSVSRLTGVPVERLQQALKAGRPQVSGARPARPPAQPQPRPQPAQPQPRPPRPVRPPLPDAGPRPPFGDAGPRPPFGEAVPRPPFGDAGPRPPFGDAVPRPIGVRPMPRPAFPAQPVGGGPGPAVPAGPRLPVVAVPPGAKRLELFGDNLVGAGGPPKVRLGGVPLEVAEADDDRLVVDLPHDETTGTLEIDHGDGEPVAFELAHEQPHDPWAPEPA
jgi:hypothetical protein